MNLKISNVILIAILANILGNCTLGFCSQNRTDIKSNFSNNSDNSEDTNNMQLVPFSGSQTLDKLKSDPDFIAAYGSIPTFVSLDERKKWDNRLANIIEEVNGNFDMEMSKYFYPNGPVTGYGETIDEVIEVDINNSETVDKPFMDEIYKIFDSKASRMGIKEVPVVFVHKDNPVPTTLTVEPVAKETANLSVSGDKNSVELNNNSSENRLRNKSLDSGFGLLGSLICLYGGWRFTKK